MKFSSLQSKTDTNTAGAQPTDWLTLRTQALQLIQGMNTGVEQWTDYNTADPGITLLESICYAITDLSYRLNFPVADLLVSGPATDATTNPTILQQFYPATQALPNAPVTKYDYRRLLLDMDGINNAWLQAHFTSGLYYVYVDYQESLTETQKIETASHILDTLKQQANLAEAFQQVLILDKEDISLNLELTVEAAENSSDVLLCVTEALNEFFTMSVKKYSFADMQDTGVAVPDILQGPLPKNGFVPDAELARTAGHYVDVFSDTNEPEELGPTFRFSSEELLSVLQSLPGVKDVHLVSWQAENTDESNIGELVIENHVPQFVQANITLFQHGFDLGQQTVNGDPLLTRHTASDIKLEYRKGKNRKLGQYSSLQNQLPEYYGVGSAGLLPGASPQRQQQARQLRAYLILFDQTLCNYFAQLDKVAELLAMQKEVTGNSAVQSYFTQSLPDDAWAIDFPDLYQQWLQNTDSTTGREEWQRCNAAQKDKLLTHLLALFSESYIPFEIYREIQETVNDLTFDADRFCWQAYLEEKQDWLNQVVALWAYRAQPQGVKEIIARKLLISSNQVQLLSNAGERQEPIPNNPIPFQISGSAVTDYFEVEITLPGAFVCAASDTPDAVQEYAFQTLLSVVPAHIRFTLKAV